MYGLHLGDREVNLRFGLRLAGTGKGMFEAN